MAQVVVTRGCQITLTKEIREKLAIREGDRVTVNTLGHLAIIAKRDPDVWDRAGDFLPEDFNRVLQDLRKDARERLDRLGIA